MDRAKVCVYCRRSMTDEDQTEDHVIGLSWFPESTPDNIEKWKVPAHKTCNVKFGATENRVRTLLALGVDRSQLAAKGVVEAALRSINPQAAKSKRDSTHRAAHRDRIVRDIYEVKSLPTAGVLPSFVSNFTELGSRHAFRIDAEDLNSVVKKWIQGIHYCEFGRILNKRDIVTVLHLAEGDALAPRRLIFDNGRNFQKGPGVSVGYVSGSDGNRRTVMYRFLIWEKFEVFGSVEERNVAVRASDGV